jgi:HK97 family phage major capsid protein
MPTLIETIEARKAKIDKKLDAIVALAETEERNVSTEEQTKVESLLEKRTAVIKSLETVRQTEEIRKENGAALKAIGYENQTRGTGEREAPYRAGGVQSYYKDLRAARQLGDSDARDRLIANDRHREDQMQQRGETTVAGAGGEFDPPLWQIDQWIKRMLPVRTTADVVNKITIPKGVSSINLPKVVTGTATAVQTMQNTGINVQDITTTSVSTAITAVAGGAVYSLQWLAQSPIPVDNVITDDIGRDLATKIDAAVIAGIAAVAGLNAITYTNASPTTALLGQYVQQGIDAVTGTNYTKPNAIIMRPDRWGRMLAYGDSAGRPLVLPNPNYGPFNTLGAANGQTVQGYAGEYRGLPVFLDPLIPNNLGAGTNQDEVFILDATQINLYESAPTVETFDATYANQMSMFLRIYEYYGLIANRLPKAISLISGTGMIPGSYGL